MVDKDHCEDYYNKNNELLEVEHGECKQDLSSKVQRQSPDTVDDTPLYKPIACNRNIRNCKSYRRNDGNI